MKPAHQEVRKLEKNTEEAKQQHRQDVALFRYGLIAPMISGLTAGLSLSAYAREAAKKPVRHPDGTERCVPEKTIMRWYRDYQKGHLEALTPKERSDKGSFRVLTDDAKERIRQLRAEFPKMNAVVLREKLVEEGVIPGTLSKSTIQRFVRSLRTKEPLSGEIKERRAFEAPYPGELWMADTKYYPVLEENGKKRRAYMMVIIDDCSRMIMGAELFYSDNAVNFLALLKTAIQTYGIPRKLYVDHGGPYDNRQLRAICADCGIQLSFAPVRDGRAKGKVERLHRTLEERLIHAVHPEEIDGLEHYNKLVREEVHRYSRTVHSVTGEMPYKAYMAGLKGIRSMDPPDRLDEIFELRTHRKVRGDSTISVDKICFDVPPQFIGMTVELRWKPERPYDFRLLFDGKYYEVHRTDRVVNYNTPRHSCIDIDYGLEEP